MPGPSHLVAMISATEFLVCQAHWPCDQWAIRKVRHCVFVEEQGVPTALEWDGMDADGLHVLACTRDWMSIGTGRLLPRGKIGRLAVLKPWRNRGIGSAMLRTLVQLGEARGQRNLYLHAQMTALGFYESGGFRRVGSPFMEAGMLHQKMHYAARGGDPAPGQ